MVIEESRLVAEGVQTSVTSLSTRRRVRELAVETMVFPTETTTEDIDTLHRTQKSIKQFLFELSSEQLI